MGFAVEQRSTPTGVRVVASGEVDVESSPRFRQALESALDAAGAAGVVRVVVDLGAVTFMDSTGLAALVACRMRARDRGITVALAAISDRVRKVLSLTGLLEVFPLEPPAG